MERRITWGQQQGWGAKCWAPRSGNRLSLNPSPPPSHSRALGATPAASGPRSSFPSPSDCARAAEAAGAKAPSARSGRGWPAPGDFSQPSIGFAIALLRIMAEAGNPNSPTGLREGGFISQRRTHSDRPGISGGRGMRSFRTQECGENKILPTLACFLLTWGEGVQGHQAPEFSVPQGSARTGIAFPLQAKNKTSFKSTPLLWFSIKAHQRATGCGSEWRQRDGEWKGGAGERSRNKLFSVQEGGERAEAIPCTHSPRVCIRYINRCSSLPRRQTLYFLTHYLHPNLGPGAWGTWVFLKGTWVGAQVSKQVKDAGFKDRGGAGRDQEESLSGS